MLALFAQQKGAGDLDAAAGGMLAMMAGIICGVLAVVIAIQIFFCLTLSKALKQVRPENRDMEPGQVWLVLIPLFNIYWIFQLTTKIPSSLRREFRERGMGRSADDYGAGVGKWYAICNVVGFVGGFIPIVNIVSLFFSLAGFVCWIMFWIKIAGYSKELREGGYDDDDRPSRSRDDDDDEDEKPRKRRRSDDDDDE